MARPIAIVRLASTGPAFGAMAMCSVSAAVLLPGTAVGVVALAFVGGAGVVGIGVKMMLWKVAPAVVAVTILGALATVLLKVVALMMCINAAGAVAAAVKTLMAELMTWVATFWVRAVSALCVAYLALLKENPWTLLLVVRVVLLVIHSALGFVIVASWLSSMKLQGEISLGTVVLGRPAKARLAVAGSLALTALRCGVGAFAIVNDRQSRLLSVRMSCAPPGSVSIRASSLVALKAAR